MSRAISSLALQAVFAGRTGQTLLTLLTISHADLVAPIRVVNNSQDIVSRGETYQWMPFEIQIPGDSGESIPRATIAIYDPSRAIASAVRNLPSAPTVTLEVIVAAAPDTVEAGPFAMTLKNVSWDELSLTAELSYEGILNEPYPGDTFTPAEYAGLF
jgi:hypothetical protein